MDYRDEWAALDNRISALARAAEYVAAVLPRAPGDGFGVVRKRIAREMTEITTALETFHKNFARNLEAPAVKALESFLSDKWVSDAPEMINANLVGIAALLTLQSEFNYTLRDIEALMRIRADNAFDHLRALLHVDKELRGRWRAALANENEPGCERLGALHLLSHGIRGFKMHGQRSITDLVFQEPLDNEAIGGAQNALILTEWKVVRQPKEMKDKVEEAIAQMREYRAGVLGHSELRNTRYIVVVTNVVVKHQRVVSSKESNVIYHVETLPLHGLTPSEVAKKLPSLGT